MLNGLSGELTGHSRTPFACHIIKRVGSAYSLAVHQALKCNQKRLANELSCRLKEIERQQAALAEEHQRTQTELERVKNEPVCVLKEINILEGEFDYVCNKHEELFRHRPGRYVFVEKAEKRRRPPPKDTNLVAIPTEVLSPILPPREPQVPMLPLETEPSTPKKTNPKKKLPDLRPVPLDLNRDDF